MGRISKSLLLLLILFLTVIITAPSFSVAYAESSNDGILPPSILFSIQNGSVIYDLGNFNVGFAIQGCSSNDMILFADLYSVSYTASWLNGSTQIYQSFEGSPNAQNNFFYSVDLTHVPQGPQQLEVTVVGGGQNYGGGSYVGTFSETSSSLLYFTISSPHSTAKPSTTLSSSAWSVQTVDSNGAYYNSALDLSPIVVDSNNTPHVAYTDFVLDYTRETEVPLVMYSSWNGVDWSIQTVAEGSTYGLLLDANNNPHILYSGWSGLAYAFWTGSNWISQTIDTNKGDGFAALALDSSGNPHVAYGNDAAIEYASWTGTNWNIQTLDEVNSSYPVSFQISLAFSSANTPYIMYNYVDNNGTEKINLVTMNDAGWSIQTAISNVNGFGNMVLDSEGFPHFICSQSLPKQYSNLDTILYVSWNGTGWSRQEVISNVQLTINNPDTNWANIGFLALDSHNQPHITYTSGGELMYTSYASDDWSIQKVNTNSSATEPGFLALDSNDKPHISYYGSTNGLIYYYGTVSFVNIMYATVTNPTQKSVPEFLVLTIPLIFVIMASAGLLVYFKKHNRQLGIIE